jgi:hypothetical protein
MTLINTFFLVIESEAAFLHISRAPVRLHPGNVELITAAAFSLSMHTVMTIPGNLQSF